LKTGYQKTVLDNGVRIVTDSIPHVRSLAIGFWFDTGSRDEPAELAGIAHFLEHMNFKGTKRRSAAKIAREIEGKGGNLNAFTSKELTCYHAHVTDDHLATSVDLLADITGNSVFDKSEMELERSVILEELKSVEDTPDELIFEHFVDQVFDPHSLGRPIIGTRETISNIMPDNLHDYISGYYGGSGLVIAAAGNLDHDRIVRLLSKRLSTDTFHQVKRTAPTRNGAGFTRKDFHTTTQQTHIAFGCMGLDYANSQKYALLILVTLLGGGMSSRLFQQIREKHGMAYTVYAFMESYRDTGLFGIYAGTLPEKAEKALGMINKEIRKITRTPVSQRELNRTKDQLKGNLKLGLESPSSRMHRLAKMELFMQKWVEIDEIIAKIDAVTSEDIVAVANRLFVEQDTCVTVLNPN
jgi:predicted Zn-dependent peptidase